METVAERNRRVAHLEAEREYRRQTRADGTVWPTPDDSGSGVTPIEVAPGRGDLNYGSSFYPSFPTALGMVGGKTISFARLFMSQPWVAAAVMRQLTWSVRVPLKMYRKVGADNARVRIGPGEHPLADAIVNPWDRGSMAQLVINLFGPLLVHGNSVTEIESGASDKIRFMPKDWRHSMPIMPFRDSVDGFRFDTDSSRFARDVSVDDTLHIAWWSPTGPIGCSPLQQLGVTINIEDSAQRYQRAQFLNGARPPSAIIASIDFLGLDKTERAMVMAQLRSDVQTIYAGPENSGRPALLPPGLDWKSIGHTSQEAELIEQRKIAREEIAGVYLIPPPMLGILDKATFSNIDTQRDMVYTDCLGPPLVLLEQCINSQIIRNLLREDDVYVEFDFGGVLRGDRLQEIQAIREGISTAVYTPNEGRDLLNMPRDDNPAMDEFYLPGNNLQPVGTPPRPRQVVVPTSTPTDVTPSGARGDEPGKILYRVPERRSLERERTLVDAR